MLKNLASWVVGPLAFLLCAIAVQVLFVSIGKPFWLGQLTMALYYTIVVLGLALITGYAGQISLGHAAFFAIGGYSTAVLTTHSLNAWKSVAWMKPLTSAKVLVSSTDLYGAQTIVVTPWAAFVVGIVLAGAIAALIGWPALRLRGYYLAMATLGFGMIVYKVLLGSTITGAADGITSVPPWRLPFGIVVTGDSDMRIQNYYLACGLVLICIILLRNVVRSRVGRALLAIHDRELAANAMGINTARYKLQAFVMSAMMAAAAGAFFTHYTGGIGPSEAGPMKSVRYLALLAAGGMTQLWGVLVISTVLTYLSLRGWFGSYDHAVFGFILVLVISLAPDGPLQPIARLLRRIWRRKRVTA